MRSNTYPTLTEALADIASRSFYESAKVTPNDDGTYTVENDAAYIDEMVMWTYDDGMELPTGALDYSRVHEPYESYDLAAHIDYNLPGAVNTLEEGKAVHFTYVVVDTYPETAEDIEDDEAGIYDGTIGWALIAFNA